MLADFCTIVLLCAQVWRSPTGEHATTTQRAICHNYCNGALLLSFCFEYFSFSRVGVLAGLKVANPTTRPNDTYSRRNDEKGDTCHNLVLLSFWRAYLSFFSFGLFAGLKLVNTTERQIYLIERQKGDKCHNCSIYTLCFVLVVTFVVFSC